MRTWIGWRYTRLTLLSNPGAGCPHLSSQPCADAPLSRCQGLSCCRHMHFLLPQTRTHGATQLQHTTSPATALVQIAFCRHPRVFCLAAPKAPTLQSNDTLHSSTPHVLHRCHDTKTGQFLDMKSVSLEAPQSCANARDPGRRRPLFCCRCLVLSHRGCRAEALLIL